MKRLVSWNVAGFRSCLKKGFEDFFKKQDADIFCLQEVKAIAEQIEFNPEGYFTYLNSAEKKGYSGSLIYSKEQALSVKYGIGDSRFDSEGRHITLEFDKYYLVTSYVPNAKRDLSRLLERMEYEDIFLKYIKTLENNKPVIICGDLNVAHQEIDIKNFKSNRGNAGFTDEERAKMTRLLANGLIDTYRFFNPEEEGAYTWWSYLGNARANNSGWRLDYFLVSEILKSKIIKPYIYSDVNGSDHCPIGLEIDL